MVNAVTLFWREEDGQALTEYALILCLVALFLVSSLIGLQGKLNVMLQTIITAMP